MERNIFVIMGRPASGKGTQAALLAQKIPNTTIVSLGKEFRSLVASETLVGKRLKAGLEAGELSPSWLADYTCEKVLLSIGESDTVVFDSGCRIKQEAVLFDEICQWLGLSYVVVYIDVSEEEITRRITERQKIEGRADDAAASIGKRIEEFNAKTTQSIDFFTEKGKLLIVDGEQTVDAVHEAVLKALGVPYNT